MRKKKFNYIYIGTSKEGKSSFLKKHVKIGGANYIKTEIRKVNTN